MIGISVIMPAYLGEYPGSRKDPDKKFIRAVESFRKQTLKEKELIIVSDGCEITNQIYQDNWKEDPSIRLVISEKMQVVWPGELREMGRSIAKYDWITYLDSDDMYLQNHLTVISGVIKNRDHGVTVFINTHYIFPFPENPNELMLAYVGMDLEKYNQTRNTLEILDGNRIAATKARGLGTWQLVHHKQIPHRWMNSEEMGEDAFFIERIKKTERIQNFRGSYLICHNTKERINIWEV